MFDKALRETKFGANEHEVVVELLKPKHHLVAAMYTKFRQHVLSKGCRVKRRKLTENEKKEMKITRRGDAWHIDVIVTKLAQITYAPPAAASSAAPMHVRARLLSLAVGQESLALAIEVSYARYN